MNKAASPRNGRQATAASARGLTLGAMLGRTSIAFALGMTLVPVPASMAASSRVDEMVAELAEVQKAPAPKAEVEQVRKVMTELAVLPSEENVAQATLDILRRARALRGDTQPIRNTEIENLVADLAEVASPRFALWDDNYKDAQVDSGLQEMDFDDDAPYVPPAEPSVVVAPEPEEEAPAPAGEAAPAEAPVAPAPGDAPEEEPPAPRQVDPRAVQDANSAIGEAMRELQQATGEVSPRVAPTTSVASAPLPKVESYKGDPLMRPVNLDFREMELSNVVALLAHMAGINVVAGTDVSGTVTANLQGVPLRQAMETALRLNGLGLSEEEGIYYIVPYEEAIAKDRRTEMITLTNANVKDIQKVLDDLVSGLPDKRQFTVTGNEAANVILISGPEKRIANLVTVARSLDVAEPVLPTVTEAIKISYGTPGELVLTIEPMLTKGLGSIAADERSRQLIVTDQPVVVEQIRQLIESLDMPVKEVMIDSMVVDVTLEDSAQTGVDWLLDVVRSQSRRDIALGNDRAIGNLQQLGLDSNLGAPNAGNVLNFGILTDNIDWRGAIQAEVRNLNGKFVSNPVVFTVENKPAKIEIVRDIPYVEVKQTNQGGSQTNTEFKQIGTILEVTPRVTHDGYIIADIQAKESDTNGEFNGIPIEDRRSVQTTMHMKDGQTIFMGGLRKRSDSTTIRKIPVLGDIPVANVLFRNHSQVERTTELLVFMTCNVIDKENNQMTPKQQMVHDDGKHLDMSVNAMQDVWRSLKNPRGSEDPMYKFRRSE